MLYAKRFLAFGRLSRPSKIGEGFVALTISQTCSVFVKLAKVSHPVSPKIFEYSVRKGEHLFRPRHWAEQCSAWVLRPYKTFRVEHFVETVDKAFRTKLLIKCFELHLILSLH